MRSSLNIYITILLLFSVLSFTSCSSNDNDPNPFETTITTSEFTTTMDENPENGQIIGTIAGTTNQGSIMFSLVEQTPANSFIVDENSGELKVLNKSIFNFEVNPIITGTIRLTNGLVYKDASVTISLNDVADVYNGGIALFTQAEVNAFGANNYEIITGGITIGNIDSLYSNITDLSPLSSLKTVGEQINLAQNNLLENLNGLNNLEEVSGYFLIRNNPALNDISALRKITILNDYLAVENNNQLTNLTGFQNLETIGSNLFIFSNIRLTNFCDLQNLLINDGLQGTYNVFNNAYNPTKQNIIDGNCSL